MKKVFKFWTVAEVKAAITCMNKFSSTYKAAEYLSPKIGKTVQNVAVKMYSIKKGMYKIEDGKLVRKERTVREPKIDKKSINLPQGFSFDFKPVRAEMFKDHVKLYF